MNSCIFSSHFLLMILFVGVTGAYGGSEFLADPCDEKRNVINTVCVSVGTNVVIICNLEDTSAAWVSPEFDTTPLISELNPTVNMLNNTVHLQFISQSSPCILSSATIHNIQHSVDGMNIMCLPNIPGRSIANFTLFVVDSIASVELIEFNLTTSGGYVNLAFINKQDCHFHHFLISSNPCGQLDHNITTEASTTSTLQAKVEVISFSNISITACTEEDSCSCQTLDFEGFLVTPSLEVLEGTSYSITLSFNHDVVIQNIGQIENGEKCNAVHNTSKTVTLSCSDLLYGTSYSLIVEGYANLTDADIGNLAFIVPLEFVTEEQPVTVEPSLNIVMEEQPITVESSLDIVIEEQSATAQPSLASITEPVLSPGFIACILLAVLLVGIMITILVWGILIIILCKRRTKQKESLNSPQTPIQPAVHVQEVTVSKDSQTPTDCTQQEVPVLPEPKELYYKKMRLVPLAGKIDGVQKPDFVRSKSENAKYELEKEMEI